MVILVILIALPFIGWRIGVGVFDFFFKGEPTNTKDTYITHIHNDNRQVHFHNVNPPEGNHLQD